MDEEMQTALEPILILAETEVEKSEEEMRLERGWMALERAQHQFQMDMEKAWADQNRRAESLNERERIILARELLCDKKEKEAT